MYKKAFGLLLSLSFICCSGPLAARPVFLSWLEKDGDSVGIIGIETEDWLMVRNLREVQHSWMPEKMLKRDDAYKTHLKNIFTQQLRAKDYGDMGVDVLTEARDRKGKSPRFPLKLLQMYEKVCGRKDLRKKYPNTQFTCTNIWDDRVEHLLLLASKKKENGMLFKEKETIGDLQRLFAQTRKNFEDATRAVSENNDDDAIDDWTLFNSTSEGMDEICNTMGHFVKKFGRDACMKSVLAIATLAKCKNRKSKKFDTCDFCRFCRMLDAISNCYWTAESFSRVISSQVKPGDRKTIIICNVDVARQIEDMLLAARYDSNYYRYDRSSGLSPQAVQSFFNYVIGRCNFCGGKGNNRCAGCKEVFYCGRDCQVSDWQNHKPVCIEEAARKKVFELLKEVSGSKMKNRDKDRFSCLKCGYNTRSPGQFFEHVPRNNQGMGSKRSGACFK